MDAAQKFISSVLATNWSHESKMTTLVRLEPTIESLYSLGKTAVKPVSLMTADDLVS